MYWVILRRPDSPSLRSDSSDGSTYVSICKMIEAEMYGMIPIEKMEKRPSAPPANMFNRPKMPPCWDWKNLRNSSGSINGTGMCVPIR